MTNRNVKMLHQKAIIEGNYLITACSSGNLTLRSQRLVDLLPAALERGCNGGVAAVYARSR